MGFNSGFKGLKHKYSERVWPSSVVTKRAAKRKTLHSLTDRQTDRQGQLTNINGRSPT